MAHAFTILVIDGETRNDEDLLGSLEFAAQRPLVLHGGWAPCVGLLGRGEEISISLVLLLGHWIALIWTRALAS